MNRQRKKREKQVPGSTLEKILLFSVASFFSRHKRCHKDVKRGGFNRSIPFDSFIVRDFKEKGRGSSGLIAYLKL